jgi:hypothetical protein
MQTAVLEEDRAAEVTVLRHTGTHTRPLKTSGGGGAGGKQWLKA